MPGTACSGGGGEHMRRRSSVVCGCCARARYRAACAARQRQGCSRARPLHDGSERSTGSTRAAAMAEPSFGSCGKGARGHERTGEKGKSTRWLTVDTQSRSAGSERRWSRRIDRQSPARRCGGDELEDDGMVILGLRGLARRKRGTRRSSGAHRRGSKMAVAVGELVGGDGCVRSRSGKGLEGEGESRE